MVTGSDQNENTDQRSDHLASEDQEVTLIENEFTVSDANNSITTSTGIPHDTLDPLIPKILIEDRSQPQYQLYEDNGNRKSVFEPYDHRDSVPKIYPLDNISAIAMRALLSPRPKPRPVSRTRNTKSESSLNESFKSNGISIAECKITNVNGSFMLSETKQPLILTNNYWIIYPICLP